MIGNIDAAIKAGKIENLGHNSGVLQKDARLAYELAELETKINFSTTYSEDDPDLFHVSDSEKKQLAQYRKEYEIPKDLESNWALHYFNKSKQSIREIIEEEGFRAECLKPINVPKMETLIKYYPQYKWIKRYYLDIDGGRKLLDDFLAEMAPAFRTAKIQGRYLYNVSNA